MILLYSAALRIATSAFVHFFAAVFSSQRTLRFCMNEERRPKKEPRSTISGPTVSSTSVCVCALTLSTLFSVFLVQVRVNPKATIFLCVMTLQIYISAYQTYIRAVMRGGNPDAESLIRDFGAAWCCMCCALAQEGRLLKGSTKI